MRLNCTLKFPRPTDLEREGIDALKKIMHYTASANDIDLKIEESREWNKEVNYISWGDVLFIIAIMLGLITIILLISYIILPSIK